MDDVPFLAASGNVVVYDTEFTSWPGFREQGFKAPGRYPEIIQIGAVMLDTNDDFKEIDSFLSYVRPAINPILSDYIQDLTGITQTLIDAEGIPFPDAFDGFHRFIDGRAIALVSYGNDGKVMNLNCRLCGIEDPLPLPPEVDLRALMTERGLAPKDVFGSDLPALLGVAGDFRAHDALGDARALAAVIRHLRREGRL